MASRLSSLLVRDGLVGVRRMERAFQRQVIDGGGLDTVLLELGLVTEERLTQYLALAAGVPPATAAEVGTVATEAAARVPRALAERTRAVPLALVDDGLRVLVCEPVEIALLEELADQLDLGVQPVIAPEFRWHLAMGHAYGWPVPARFTALAAQLEVAGPAPVGRARSVIVDEPVAAPPAGGGSDASVVTALAQAAEAAQVIAPIAAEAPTARLAAAPAAAAIDEVELLRRAAERAAEWSEREHTDPDGRSAALALADARRRLQLADHRDAIWTALLDGARTRVSWAGIFTLQRGVATGRRAAAEVEVDQAAIAALALPVAAVPAMQRAVASRRVALAPLGTGDQGLDAQLSRLGGNLLAPAMVLPISLGDRVVALLVGHRGVTGVGLADIAEVLPLADVAAEALGRLISKHKDEQRSASGAVAVPVVPGPTLDVDALLDRVEAGDEDAFDEALDHGRALLDRLAARFPGALRTTRYQVGSRVLRAGQHGHLLDLIVQIGPLAAPLLLAKLTDDDRDVRYYATACLAEQRPAAAVSALVERVFDADFGVRTVALEALAGYPRREIGPSLVALRNALHASDEERMRAAAEAIGELLDTGAIAALIDTLDDEGRRGDIARRALMRLTRHDFGTSSKKWRTWWQLSERSHRLQWLIDALALKDDALRVAAFDELRRLTGETLGYAEDLPRREREAAIERWHAWWRVTGQRRFG